MTELQTQFFSLQCLTSYFPLVISSTHYYKQIWRLKPVKQLFPYYYCISRSGLRFQICYNTQINLDCRFQSITQSLFYDEIVKIYIYSKQKIPSPFVYQKFVKKIYVFKLNILIKNPSIHPRIQTQCTQNQQSVSQQHSLTLPSSKPTAINRLQGKAPKAAIFPPSFKPSNPLSYTAQLFYVYSYCYQLISATDKSAIQDPEYTIAVA
eukprot:TRINITY_DN9092_c0_g2_i3.p1 TRINITY_DN9092_c0_g2~~TRINITY_DN9092_c0_g2_i3.p1  ORF type:complete len:208 (+),score=-17.98 TRINITY_DN9092_c0_g2_i3:156-779(+)